MQFEKFLTREGGKSGALGNEYFPGAEEDTFLTASANRDRCVMALTKDRQAE
jgi:hypothetical protein